MSKRITLSDEEYWKLAEMKLRFKTDSLIVIFAKLEEQPKQPERISTEPAKTANQFLEITGIKPEMCVCGHSEAAHEADGCLGNGAQCDCAIYRKAESERRSKR